MGSWEEVGDLFPSIVGRGEDDLYSSIVGEDESELFSSVGNSDSTFGGATVRWFDAITEYSHDNHRYSRPRSWHRYFMLNFAIIKAGRW